MLKKRVVSIVLAAMLAVGGSAFACDNCGGTYDVNVSGNYVAAPYADKKVTDYDVNDKVTAGGWTQTVVDVNTVAAGDDFAAQAGSAEAFADVDAYANNWDNGLSSGAYAEASFNGGGEGFGIAGAGFGGKAEVTVNSQFSGYVYQNQITQEINYQNGQGITATNSSDATFTGMRKDSDYDCERRWIAGAAEFDSIRNGGTEVTGSSFVTIDPTGDNRSYSGMTTSDAKIGTSNAQVTESQVNGTGFIGGLVQNPQAGFATGAATYTFTGDHAGVGVAQIEGAVQNQGGSYSTAQSSGSSAAFAF